MPRDRFKSGSGCYECISCGKRTRETGDEEGELRLCRRCFRESERENFHSDDGHTEPIESCPICLENGLTQEWIDS